MLRVVSAISRTPANRSTSHASSRTNGRRVRRLVMSVGWSFTSRSLIEAFRNCRSSRHLGSRLGGFGGLSGLVGLSQQALQLRQAGRDLFLFLFVSEYGSDPRLKHPERQFPKDPGPVKGAVTPLG